MTLPKHRRFPRNLTEGAPPTYYFNARWYDPELGRFTTEDPIKDGGNWYAYVGNRPLVITDPTGLLSDWNRFRLGLAKFAGMDQEKVKSRLEAEERNVIDKRLEDYKKLKESGEVDQIEKEEKKILKMMGDYNRDVVPDSVEDYGGERITGYFDQYDPYAQEHRQNPHPGIDFVGGKGFKTPWYTMPEGVSLSQPSNPFILSVPGTTYRIRVKHADREDVEAFQVAAQSSDEVYRPEERIVPYPERPNGTDAIHYHIEIRTTEPSKPSPLINPLGLNLGRYLNYLYEYDHAGSGDWRSMSYSW